MFGQRGYQQSCRSRWVENSQQKKKGLFCQVWALFVVWLPCVQNFIMLTAPLSFELRLWTTLIALNKKIYFLFRMLMTLFSRFKGKAICVQIMELLSSFIFLAIITSVFMYKREQTCIAIWLSTCMHVCFIKSLKC